MKAVEPKASQDRMEITDANELQRVLSLSLVDVFDLHNSINHLKEGFLNFDPEAFVGIHKEALEKYLTTGEYFHAHHRPGGVEQSSYKSLEPAHDLVPVEPNDLKIGKCNMLKVLYGELCVEPLEIGGNVYSAMIEAYSGKAIALSIISANYLSVTYSQGLKVAIKEPRMLRGDTGFIWIEVDNPLAIERLERFSYTPLSEILKDKMEECFDNGKRAHKDEKWKACIKNYTKYEICASKVNHALTAEKMELMMYYQRWRAYMELHRHYLALKDAESCCRLDPINRKAILAKIISLVSVGRYKDAHNFVGTSCNMFEFGPYDLHLDYAFGNTKQLFIDTYRRNCVEYYGVGEAIAEIAEKPNLCKPDDDYVGPVEIKKSVNRRGRGMFALEPIKTGTVILICKALARCNNYEHGDMHCPKNNGLILKVMNELKASGKEMLFLSLDPSREKYLKHLTPKLHNFFSKPSSSQKNINDLVEGSAKLDPVTISRITKCIAFDDRSPFKIKENARAENYFNTVAKRCYYGVWLIPSFMNHSCLPNASRMNVGDVMTVHATTDINAGEEITIPYFNVLLPYNVREIASKARGFRCLCERCELERKVSVQDADLKDIYEVFGSIYRESVASNNHAGHLIFRGNGTGSVSRSGIDIEGMKKLYEKVTDGLRKFMQKRIVGEERMHWIVSSFTFAHLAPFLVFSHEDNQEDKEKSWEHYQRCISNVAQVIAGTCPGDLLHLFFWLHGTSSAEEDLQRTIRIRETKMDIFESNQLTTK